MKKILLFLFCALFSVGARPDEDSEQLQRLHALDQRCEEARAQALLIIQQKKVEECVKTPPPPRADPMTREECEQYWSDYGWSTGGVTGSAHRMFGDLPECLEAFEAWQAYQP